MVWTTVEEGFWINKTIIKRRGLTVNAVSGVISHYHGAIDAAATDIEIETALLNIWYWRLLWVAIPTKILSPTDSMPCH